jgi:hypothetical protein
METAPAGFVTSPNERDAPPHRIAKDLDVHKIASISPFC